MATKQATRRVDDETGDFMDASASWYYTWEIDTISSRQVDT